MARDYRRKNRRSNVRRSKRASSGWLRIVLGCCVGAVLTVAVFVHFILPQDFLGLSSPEKEESSTTAAKPRFDFYNILPEMEVKVPGQQQSAPASKAQALQPQQDQNAEKSINKNVASHYRLQLASFKSFAEADRFKAQLALSGIEAEIDSVDIKAGETWHRVRTILYSTREQAEEVQKQLEAEGVQGILLKEKS